MPTPPTDPKLADTRRRRIEAYIANHYKGRRAQFARDTAVHPNQVNLILTENESLRRNCTDVIADRICDNLGLPRGYFDSAVDGQGHTILAAKVPDEHLMIFTPCRTVASLAVSGEWLIQLRVDDVADQLKLAEVACDDLRDTLPPGTTVVVAPATEVTRDGIYALDGKSGPILRRVRRKLSGYELTSNTPKAPELVSTFKGSKVIGRVIAAVPVSPM